MIISCTFHVLGLCSEWNPLVSCLTVSIGQTWHCCSEVSVGSWFGGRTSKSHVFGCFCSSQWWLAACPSNLSMWLAPGWRSRSRGRGTVFGIKSLCPTFMPLWKKHGWMGSTCFCVQARATSHSRHHALDIIDRACASAGVSVSKEPSCLFPADIRRSFGLTLILWQAGKALAWDATVTSSTLADSYIHQSATKLTAKAAAELAAAWKVSKYADLPSFCMFYTAALKTINPINNSAIQFIDDLGRKSHPFTTRHARAYFCFSGSRS